jgi:hypothetical protein
VKLHHLVCLIFLWVGVFLGDWAANKVHERETRLADCMAMLDEATCGGDESYGRLVLDSRPGHEARVYWKNTAGECWEICATAEACEKQALLHNTECP